MEEKKTLKGFTLVELIIVLAIFSVILALVMSFIDPVSNLMKNTSIRERTAAYSDNISEYIDNSLHYSKFMYVYEGDLLRYHNTEIASDETKQAGYKAVAAKIVKNNLDGAVYKTKDNHVTGKVRIMEFDNSEDDKGRVGQIYDSVWNFVCADIGDEPTITLESAPTPILNQEHFENYNYHYSIGYYDFKAYNPHKGEFGKKGTYESKLVPRTDRNGNVISVSEHNFPINVVAYGNNDYRGADGNDPTFKSPTYMSTVSMALVNVINISRADTIDYYSFNTVSNSFEPIPCYPFESEDHKTAPTEITDADGNTLGYDFKGSSFYVAYILPYEIADSDVTLS